MTSKASKKSEAVDDGRAQRSIRSRQLIIDSMVELINEGNLIPTAQQVADRAGVTIRTVFRHFSEMEKLFAELDASMRPAYEKLFQSTDRSGSLDERILHAVQCHADGYVAMSQIMQSTRSQLWRWPILRKNYGRNQRKLRKDLDNWLPELKKVSSEIRESIDAITSFEFWDRLMSQQGLSKKASIALIADLVRGLL